MDQQIVAVNSRKVVGDKCDRVSELRQFNLRQWAERRRIRDIMDGGPPAIAALLGNTVSDPNLRLPVANLLVTAANRLGQKLGAVPQVKVDPPTGYDSDSARKSADRRSRIMLGLDYQSKLPLLLPQAGRWVPGYGYAAATLRQGTTVAGSPFPDIELRDPYTTFIGDWGAKQQPDDIAFVRVVPRHRLAAMYPQYKTQILRSGMGDTPIVEMPGTGFAPDRAGWENQGGAGIEVWEYMDREGTWMVVPSIGEMLFHIPNPMSRAQFRVVKRFAFNNLVGEYDHAIGLLAALARVNLLATIGIEDAVMAELWVFGDLVHDEYNRGRNAINYFTPGSKVERSNSQVPMEAFQHADRLERQLRNMSAYPVQDDSVSPSSWTTGKGLQELSSGGVLLEVREYQTAFADWLVELDSLRSEFLEVMYPDMTLTVEGVSKNAAFTETFVPQKHIAGNWRTRREYGAMAGFDDAAKLVGLLQCLQAGLIDIDTARENLEGFGDHAKIRDRIREDKLTEIAMQGLAALVQQGDPKGIEAAVKLLPDGTDKTIFTEVFLSKQEEQQEPAAPAGPGGPGQPPDFQSVMERLYSNGSDRSYVQSGGPIAGAA